MHDRSTLRAYYRQFLGQILRVFCIQAQEIGGEGGEDGFHVRLQLQEHLRGLDHTVQVREDLLLAFVVRLESCFGHMLFLCQKRAQHLCHRQALQPSGCSSLPKRDKCPSRLLSAAALLLAAVSSFRRFWSLIIVTGCVPSEKLLETELSVSIHVRLLEAGLGALGVQHLGRVIKQGTKKG